MTKPLITIHDLEADTIVTREMNDEEFMQYQNEQAQRLAHIEAQAQADAAKAAAQEKFATLGLTIDDLKALGL